MDLHFENIHKILALHHKEDIEANDEDAAKKSYDLVNVVAFVAIMIFERFPESEDYCAKWRNKVNLYANSHDPNSYIHAMPETIQ